MHKRDNETQPISYKTRAERSHFIWKHENFIHKDIKENRESESVLSILSSKCVDVSSWADDFGQPYLHDRNQYSNEQFIEQQRL